jgi:PRC-barrel domain
MPQSQDNQPSSELIASDKVEGTPIYNRSGERLGSVHNLIVNKRSGQVAYAVASFGGFLGIGSSYHPLPWNELTYDTSLDGYMVDRTKEQLEGAPTYSASDLQSWNDAVHGGAIHAYFSGTHGRGTGRDK